VFVILDNLNVHKSTKVRALATAHRDALALFYLPPYAAELNSGDYLNGDLKLGVANRALRADENRPGQGGPLQPSNAATAACTRAAFLRTSAHRLRRLISPT